MIQAKRTSDGNIEEEVGILEQWVFVDHKEFFFHTSFRVIFLKEALFFRGAYFISNMISGICFKNQGRMKWWVVSTNQTDSN